MGYKLVNEELYFVSNYKTNKKEIEIFETNSRNIIIHVQTETFTSQDINIIHSKSNKEIFIKNETDKEIVLDVSKINIKVYEINFLGFTIVGDVKSHFGCIFRKCKLTNIKSGADIEIGEDSEVESVEAARIFLFSLKDIKNQIKVTNSGILKVYRSANLSLDITNVQIIEIDSSEIVSVSSGDIQSLAFNWDLKSTHKVAPNKKCEIYLIDADKVPHNADFESFSKIINMDSKCYINMSHWNLINNQSSSPKYLSSEYPYQILQFNNWIDNTNNSKLDKIFNSDVIDSVISNPPMRLLNYLAGINQLDKYKTQLEKLPHKERGFEPDTEISNKTCSFFSQNATLARAFIRYIGNISTNKISYKNLLTIYKTVYNDKIKHIYASHVNSVTIASMDSNTLILNITNESIDNELLSFFCNQGTDYVDKILNELPDDIKLTIAANTRPAHNIYYPKEKITIPLSTYISIKYFANKIIVNGFYYDGIGLDWIKKHLNVKYILEIEMIDFNNESDFDRTDFKEVLFDGQEEEYIKYMGETGSTYIAKYLVNHLKTKYKQIDKKLLLCLLNTVAANEDRYSKTVEEMINYLQQSKIKLDDGLIEYAKDNDYKIDYSDLLVRDMTVDSNSPIIRELIDMEQIKIKNKILFKKNHREKSYIYIDTINELKTKYNKNSNEYLYLKSIETSITEKIHIDSIPDEKQNEQTSTSLLMDEIIETEQTNIENNIPYANSPRKTGIIYKDTISLYKQLKQYASILSNIEETISIDELKNHLQQNKTIYDEIIKDCQNITNFMFEQRKIIQHNQTIHPTHEVFRCNLKSITQYDDEVQSDIIDYAESAAQSDHPVNYKGTTLTVSWIRFDISEVNKSIWVNEIQSDVTKTFKITPDDYSNLVLGKIITNTLYSFIKWVKKHYEEYNIVLPGHILREKALGGKPTPNAYDNPAKKLKFKKQLLSDTTWKEHIILKNHDGIVWVYTQQ